MRSAMKNNIQVEENRFHEGKFNLTVNGRVENSEPIKFENLQMEKKEIIDFYNSEFKEYVDSDSVIKKINNYYNQETQYRKSFSLEELKKFYIEEYI